MAPVYNLAAYRFYRNVKQRLDQDNIKCNFHFNDPTYVKWVVAFSENKVSWAEFYTAVASYAMELDSITVK